MTDHLNRRATLAHLAALGASLTATLAWPTARAADAGTAAPAIDLPGTGAARVQLSALAGKVIYLDFWASWCGPCRQSFPWMNEMQARHGAAGLQVLGINVDKRQADADRFLSETPAKFLVAFDPQGDTPKRYAIKGMPTSLLIGPDGKVLSSHSGFRDEERAELEARIVAALGQLPRRPA
jgi:cytochrome c biogenesis protein CcmG, thiol:disulfide interchange protein DsbE